MNDMAATPAPVPTVMTKSIPPETGSLVTPAPTSAVDMNVTAAPAPALPPQTLESGHAGNAAAPDIFTRIAELVSTHPGIVFFLGCLFVITIVVLIDYRRKRNNG